MEPGQRQGEKNRQGNHGKLLPRLSLSVDQTFMQKGIHQVYEANEADDADNQPYSAFRRANSTATTPATAEDHKDRDIAAAIRALGIMLFIWQPKVGLALPDVRLRLR